MKAKVGDWVFTNDDLGVVEKVNEDSVEIWNNVNTYTVPNEDIREVF